MDDVKDKMKGLMKKVNNPFSSSSSSSGKFKGHGRVLGSAPSPSSSSPSSDASSAALRRLQPPPRKNPPVSNTTRPSAEFHPFRPLVSSSAGSDRKAYAESTFLCPVCSTEFPSETAISNHIDSCLSTPIEVEPVANGSSNFDSVAAHVSAFVSGKPPAGSAEVVLRLLRNIVKEPSNDKFRKVRLGNPKIKEAIGEVEGGVELLECVGFTIVEEEGEVWAKMDIPSGEQVKVIGEAVLLLEAWIQGGSSKEQLQNGDSATNVEEPKVMDRKVRVFFPVPESAGARIDLPDSYYSLSAEEIRREALQRKKKIEESQLLIPKSFREKQASATSKKYKVTVIRIQFPDGVVLQALFSPSESTTTLYEFVSSSLKDPTLEFELLKPAVPKASVIPRFGKEGVRSPTLQDVELVPSARLRFKPSENESMVFTGLTNELLEISEPMTSMAAIS